MPAGGMLCMRQIACCTGVLPFQHAWPELVSCVWGKAQCVSTDCVGHALALSLGQLADLLLLNI